MIRPIFFLPRYLIELHLESEPIEPGAGVGSRLRVVYFTEDKRDFVLEFLIFKLSKKIEWYVHAIDYWP